MNVCCVQQKDQLGQIKEKNELRQVQEGGCSFINIKESGVTRVVSSVLNISLFWKLCSAP